MKTIFCIYIICICKSMAFQSDNIFACGHLEPPLLKSKELQNLTILFTKIQVYNKVAFRFKAWPQHSTSFQLTKKKKIQRITINQTKQHHRQMSFYAHARLFSATLFDLFLCKQDFPSLQFLLQIFQLNLWDHRHFGCMVHIPYQGILVHHPVGQSKIDLSRLFYMYSCIPVVDAFTHL